MKIISNRDYRELKEEISELKENLSLKSEEYDCLRARKNSLELKLESAQKDLNEIREKLTREFEFREKTAVAAMEDKIAKMRNQLEIDHAKQISNLEKNLEKKKNDALEKMMKEHYEKLSDAMSKLHQEGNAQTKFMQEITNNVIKSASGFSRLEHKE